MKLKGTMTIELTDADSGETEVIQEGNMVTDAVDNILGSNLLGMYFDSGIIFIPCRRTTPWPTPPTM